MDIYINRYIVKIPKRHLPPPLFEKSKEGLEITFFGVAGIVSKKTEDSITLELEDKPEEFLNHEQSEYTAIKKKVKI